MAHDAQEGQLILVDTGAGNKWGEDEARRYAIENHAQALPEALAAMGLSEDEVTDVVITHAHFDHCGGLTEWKGEPGGETQGSFQERPALGA